MVWLPWHYRPSSLVSPVVIQFSLVYCLMQIFISILCYTTFIGISCNTISHILLYSLCDFQISMREKTFSTNIKANIKSKNKLVGLTDSGTYSQLHIQNWLVLQKIKVFFVHFRQSPMVPQTRIPTAVLWNPSVNAILKRKIQTPTFFRTMCLIRPIQTLTTITQTHIPTVLGLNGKITLGDLILGLLWYKMPIYQNFITLWGNRVKRTLQMKCCYGYRKNSQSWIRNRRGKATWPSLLR